MLCPNSGHLLTVLAKGLAYASPFSFLHSAEPARQLDDLLRDGLKRPAMRLVRGFSLRRKLGIPLQRARITHGVRIPDFLDRRTKQ
jgi:hypothetical protein